MSLECAHHHRRPARPSMAIVTRRALLRRRPACAAAGRHFRFCACRRWRPTAVGDWRARRRRELDWREIMLVSMASSWPFRSITKPGARNIFSRLFGILHGIRRLSILNRQPWRQAPTKLAVLLMAGRHKSVDHYASTSRGKSNLQITCMSARCIHHLKLLALAIEHRE